MLFMHAKTRTRARDVLNSRSHYQSVKTRYWLFDEDWRDTRSIRKKPCLMPPRATPRTPPQTSVTRFATRLRGDAASAMKKPRRPCSGARRAARAVAAPRCATHHDTSEREPMKLFACRCLLLLAMLSLFCLLMLVILFEKLSKRVETLEGLAWSFHILLHWRLSCHFSHIDEMLNMLSRTTYCYLLHMRCLLSFGYCHAATPSAADGLEAPAYAEKEWKMPWLSESWRCCRHAAGRRQRNQPRHAARHAAMREVGELLSWRQLRAARARFVEARRRWTKEKERASAFSDESSERERARRYRRAP